jgi:hypothetical protein
MADSIRKLRTLPEAGQLFRVVETWLHSNPEDSSDRSIAGSYLGDTQAISVLGRRWRMMPQTLPIWQLHRFSQ